MNKEQKEYLDKISYEIQKNIEQNSEETEKSFIDRINVLEENIKELLGGNIIKTDSQNNEDIDNDEESIELDKSIADKFKPPPPSPDNINTNERLANMESHLMDVNMRVDNLEKTQKAVYKKLNDLVKVNNAILKNLEQNNKITKADSKVVNKIESSSKSLSKTSKKINLK